MVTALLNFIWQQRPSFSSFPVLPACRTLAGRYRVNSGASGRTAAQTSGSYVATQIHTRTHKHRWGGDASENRGRLVSRNAINQGKRRGREKKAREDGKRRRKKTEEETGEVRAGESVFGARVHREHFLCKLGRTK